MPKEGRPRERFLKYGAETLSDAELFAILLRTGIRGKKNDEGEYEGGENVIEMSNRLINEYGLDKLLECSLVELQKINGIGPSKAMQILTIAELQKRINQSKKPVKKISCAEDVFNYFNDFFFFVFSFSNSFSTSISDSFSTSSTFNFRKSNFIIIQTL